MTSCELYNLSTDIWTITEKMHNSRAYHTASLLTNGKLLVTGGSCENGSTMASVELYDPLSQRWTVSDTMQIARIYHTASLLNNGHVLIAAGDSGGDFDAAHTAELYNTST